MADGSRIRELRTRRGLLQRELAEMAGVTESAVRNYELGLRTPRPQHLEALARALGVAPAALADYGVETARDAIEVLFVFSQVLLSEKSEPFFRVSSRKFFGFRRGHAASFLTCPA